MAQRLRAAERVLMALGGIALGRTALKLFLPPLGDNFFHYSLMLMGQQLLLYGLPALLLRRESRVPTPNLPEETEELSPLGWMGVAGAAIMHQCALVLLTLVSAQWLAFMGLSVTSTSLMLPATPAEGVAAAAAFCLLPALCEEMLFRGRVLPGLSCVFSPRMSLALTALLFALMHGQLAALPSHLAAGLMMTALCLKSGLTAAMVYHGVFNLTSLCLSLWQRSAGWQQWLMHHPPLLMALMGLLLLLGGLAAWGLLRGLRLEPGEKAPRRAALWAAGILVMLLPAYLIELLPR